VNKESEEFKSIAAHSEANIIRIERIQNHLIWDRFYGYSTCHPETTQQFYWHGTSTTNPRVIYDDKVPFFFVFFFCTPFLFFFTFAFFL